MADEADRVEARGFAERAGMIITAALPRRKHEALSDVVHLTEPEIAMVSGWITPRSWRPPRRTNGRPVPPPGAGKMLIEVGERAGVPVEVDVTETELALHDINSRWHDHHLPAPAYTEPVVEVDDSLDEVDDRLDGLDDPRGDEHPAAPEPVGAPVGTSAGSRGSGW